MVNGTGILQKMVKKQILKAPEHSRKDLFESEKTEILPTTQFYNGKSLKDYLVQAWDGDLKPIRPRDVNYKGRKPV